MEAQTKGVLLQHRDVLAAATERCLRDGTLHDEDWSTLLHAEDDTDLSPVRSLTTEELMILECECHYIQSSRPSLSAENITRIRELTEKYCCALGTTLDFGIASMIHVMTTIAFPSDTSLLLALHNFRGRFTSPHLLSYFSCWILPKSAIDLPVKVSKETTDSSVATASSPEAAKQAEIPEWESSIDGSQKGICQSLQVTLPFTIEKLGCSISPISFTSWELDIRSAFAHFPDNIYQRESRANLLRRVVVEIDHCIQSLLLYHTPELASHFYNNLSIWPSDYASLWMGTAFAFGCSSDAALKNIRRLWEWIIITNECSALSLLTCALLDHYSQTLLSIFDHRQALALFDSIQYPDALQWWAEAAMIGKRTPYTFSSSFQDFGVGFIPIAAIEARELSDTTNGLHYLSITPSELVNVLKHRAIIKKQFNLKTKQSAGDGTAAAKPKPTNASEGTVKESVEKIEGTEVGGNEVNQVPKEVCENGIEEKEEGDDLVENRVEDNTAVITEMAEKEGNVANVETSLDIEREQLDTDTISMAMVGEEESGVNISVEAPSDCVKNTVGVNADDIADTEVEAAEGDFIEGIADAGANATVETGTKILLEATEETAVEATEVTAVEASEVTPKQTIKDTPKETIEDTGVVTIVNTLVETIAGISLGIGVDERIEDSPNLLQEVAIDPPEAVTGKSALKVEDSARTSVTAMDGGDKEVKVTEVQVLRDVLKEERNEAILSLEGNKDHSAQDASMKDVLAMEEGGLNETSEVIKEPSGAGDSDSDEDGGIAYIPAGVLHAFENKVSTPVYEEAVLDVIEADASTFKKELGEAETASATALNSYALETKNEIATNQISSATAKRLSFESLLKKCSLGVNLYNLAIIKEMQKDGFAVMDASKKSSIGSLSLDAVIVEAFGEFMDMNWYVIDSYQFWEMVILDCRSVVEIERDAGLYIRGSINVYRKLIATKDSHRIERFLKLLRGLGEKLPCVLGFDDHLEAVYSVVSLLVTHGFRRVCFVEGGSQGLFPALVKTGLQSNILLSESSTSASLFGNVPTTLQLTSSSIVQNLTKNASATATKLIDLKHSTVLQDFTKKWSNVKFHKEVPEDAPASPKAVVVDAEETGHGKLGMLSKFKDFRFKHLDAIVHKGAEEKKVAEAVALDEKRLAAEAHRILEATEKENETEAGAPSDEVAVEVLLEAKDKSGEEVGKKPGGQPVEEPDLEGANGSVEQPMDSTVVNGTVNMDSEAAASSMPLLEKKKGKTFGDVFARFPKAFSSRPMEVSRKKWPKMQIKGLMGEASAKNAEERHLHTENNAHVGDDTGASKLLVDIDDAHKELVIHPDTTPVESTNASPLSAQDESLVGDHGVSENEDIDVDSSVWDVLDHDSVFHIGCSSDEEDKDGATDISSKPIAAANPMQWIEIYQSLSKKIQGLTKGTVVNLSELSGSIANMQSAKEMQIYEAFKCSKQKDKHNLITSTEAEKGSARRLIVLCLNHVLVTQQLQEDTCTDDEQDKASKNAKVASSSKPRNWKFNVKSFRGGAKKPNTETSATAKACGNGVTNDGIIRLDTSAPFSVIIKSNRRAENIKSVISTLGNCRRVKLILSNGKEKEFEVPAHELFVENLNNLITKFNE